MNIATEIDLAVSARWILPVIPRKRALENCSLLVDKGKILTICPQSDLENRFIPRKHLQLGESAIMPGLVNAHGHAAMSLLRGYSDDLPLKQWLEEHIWPAEQRWVSPEFVRDGSELAIAEMLLSGTTCFSDMYFFPEETAKVATAAGIRAQLNFPVFEFTNAWATSAEDCIHKGLELRDNLRLNSLVRIAFGPHAPYTVSDESFRKIAIYANELQMPVHIHLHETADEIDESIKQYGLRPINRLADLGILGPNSQCVHFTHANDNDIELLQTWQSSVVHCPQSNLKLASGFCPVDKLLQKDINVALGTDSAASNNSLNLFSELKLAALLGKAVANKADAVDAHLALEMATINGAKALGMDKEVGSLEPGKAADFIAVDLSEIQFAPIFDPVSHLVYTSMGHNVSHVWINGKLLVENKQLKTLDSTKIKQKALAWQVKIATL